MSSNRDITAELPRKPAAAFFRWETPGEPLAVHFHLNIVDLLERDFVGKGETGVTGVLLGRIEPGRTLKLIVEDYEPTPNPTSLDACEPGVGDNQLLEEIVNRWHSQPEKRISVLGFYRSCGHGQVSLTRDDLEMTTALLTEPERIFLLIEPRWAKASNATLYMIRDGAVVWKWHSLCFDRKQLTDGEDSLQSPVPSLQGSSAQSRKPVAPETQDFSARPEKALKVSHSKLWGLGIVAGLALAAAGIFPIRNIQFFHALSDGSKVSDRPGALGLKLEDLGSDWRLSWDPTSPVLLKAAGGHLLVTDGFIHKTLDLDVHELQGGSLMYTPVTDDVTLRLEIVSPESVTLADESTRMIAGLLPSPRDSVQTNGGFHDTPADSDEITSETFSSSAPGKRKVPLTMRPPAAAIRHDVANSEPINTLPNSVNALHSVEILSSPSLVAAPPELKSQTAGPEWDDENRPAKLIAGSEAIYPTLARTFGIAGTVELKLRIAATGKVKNVTVLGGPPALANAAVEAAKGWRFDPAQANGNPVDSDLTTTVVFKLNR